MAENRVKLLIDNTEEYEGWESVEITSELNTIARSFQVAITTKTPTGSFSLKSFFAGKNVRVLIDDDIVLTGYIDQTPVTYDANQRTITIAGRSKTSDLIDCCAFPSGIPMDKATAGVHEWTERSHIDGVIVKPADNTSRNWHSEKIEKIIATLIAPYNIKFVSEVNSPSVKNNFSITNTDKIIDSIRNLTKNEDFLFSDNENGDLVLVKKSTNEASKTVGTALVLGENILKATADFDGTKLYSHYGVVGQNKGSNNNSGIKVSNNDGEAEGYNQLKRKRYIYERAKGQADKDSCDKEARGNRDYSDNQFYKTTYTVQGWRDNQGKLWKVNTLVNVKDDFLHNDLLCLITKVRFSLTNNGGMITELDVVPPKGFRIESMSDDKNVNKTKKTASSQKLAVNRNRYPLWSNNNA